MANAQEPERFTVPVSGGGLTVGRWGGGEEVVLAIHGITASHMEFSFLADALGDEVTLVAPDLRGRGDSNRLGPPYGMAQHAADCVAILDRIGAERALVLGHSMGGFVATVMALHHPGRVRSLVLVDGGYRIMTPPPDVDIDQILQAVIGPSMERIKMTFQSRDAYHEFWRQHPSLQDEGVWGAYLEAYVDYDLGGQPPNLRSKVALEAIREDARDTLVNQDVALAIEKLPCPAVLMRAPRGVLNEPQGLYPDEVAKDLVARVPNLDDELVEGVNHFTILISRPGAERVALRITKMLAET